jgi:hypothetical protein
MNTNETDDSIESLLRAAPLRPQDAAFTRRVLRALPVRTRNELTSHGSFALASRAGLVLALLVAAQRWYVAGVDGAETLLALLLFLAPAFAAASRLCGPLIPRTLLRVFRLGSRNWR